MNGVEKKAFDDWPCRWRGRVSPTGATAECLTPKLRAPGGVTAEACARCWCRDHEPGWRRPSPAPRRPGPLARLRRFVSRVLRFGRAAVAHAGAGFPKVTPEQLAERLATCEACPKKADRTCALCGCGLARKAAWADQQCPDDPPRWRKLTP